jgi:hypothetical protein
VASLALDILDGMLLAEDLLLLLTDDEAGTLLAPAPQVDVALGGAQLVELSIGGRVDIDGRSRLRVLDASRTGNDLLDRALSTLQRREGKRPAAVVTELGKALREALYERLATAGYVRADHGRVLGLFPRTTWPAVSADREGALRRALTVALVDGGDPQPREAALISLLHALRVTSKVVDPREHGVRRRDLDRRAKAISQGSWGSDAVRKAIDASSAAVTAAVAGSVVAATAAT